MKKILSGALALSLATWLSAAPQTASPHPADSHPSGHAARQGGKSHGKKHRKTQRRQSVQSQPIVNPGN